MRGKYVTEASRVSLLSCCHLVEQETGSLLIQYVTENLLPGCQLLSHQIKMANLPRGVLIGVGSNRICERLVVS